MDPLTRLWYQLLLQEAAYQESGVAFQDLFSSIMEKAYPGDFVRVKPWGSTGDRKCDGYLRSQRIVFQVYKPERYKEPRVLAKIDEDFKGALEHWPNQMRQWVFVHGCYAGLSPRVLQRLVSLSDAHPGVEVKSWGLPEIKVVLFDLDATDLEQVLGSAPTERDLAEVRMEDLESVLEHIAEMPPGSGADLRPVPAEKLEASGLSPAAAGFLLQGMKKADLVGRYFSDQFDPLRADRIATTFKRRYTQLRELGLPPDSIFHSLQQLAAGRERRSPKREAAILSVLAYLFETCDIYERPDQETKDATAD